MFEDLQLSPRQICDDHGLQILCAFVALLSPMSNTSHEIPKFRDHTFKL